MKLDKKGQSTLEYAVLVIILIGALLSLQVYVKRGIQGRLKQSSDDIGDQFSDGNQNFLRVTLSHSKTGDTFTSGQTRSVLFETQTTNTAVSSNIIKPCQEFWGVSSRTQVGNSQCYRGV